MYRLNKLLSYFLVFALLMTSFFGMGGVAFAGGETVVIAPVTIGLVGQPTLDGNSVSLTVKAANGGDSVDNVLFYLVVEGELSDEEITVDYGQGSFVLAKSAEGRYEGSFGPGEGFTMESGYEAETTFTALLADPEGDRAITIDAWLYQVGDVESKLAEMNQIRVDIPGVTMVAEVPVVDGNSVGLKVRTVNLGADIDNVAYHLVVEGNLQDEQVTVTYPEGSFVLHKTEEGRYEGQFGPGSGFTLSRGWDVTTEFTAGFSPLTGDETVTVFAWLFPVADQETKLAVMNPVSVRFLADLALTEVRVPEVIGVGANGLDAYELELVANRPVTFGYTISDKNGDVVFEGETTDLDEALTVVWNGTTESGSVAGNGYYDLSLIARDEDGNEVNFETRFGLVKFVDIVSNWARDTIKQMALAGVINGYDVDNTFRPQNWISRQDFAILVARNFNLQSSPGFVTSFTDISGERVYGAKAIMALEEMGVLRGYLQNDGTYLFKPEENITRAESAVLFALLLEAPIVDETFESKLSDISGWYAGYVKSLESLGKVSGYEEKGVFTFRPASHITRAETASMVSRIAQEEVKARGLSLEEALVKGLEETKNLTSYSYNTELGLLIDVEGGEEDFFLNMNFTLFGKANLEKDLYNINYLYEVNGEASLLESYINSEYRYMRDSASETFMRFPVGDDFGVEGTPFATTVASAVLVDLLKEGGVDVVQQPVNLAGKRMTRYTVTLDGQLLEGYVASLLASEEFGEFLQENEFLLGEDMVGFLQEFKDVVNLVRVEFTYLFDGQHMLNQKIVVTSQVEEEGQTVTMRLTTSSTIADINGIDDIQFPEEYVDFDEIIDADEDDDGQSGVEDIKEEDNKNDDKVEIGEGDDGDLGDHDQPGQSVDGEDQGGN